MRLAFWRSEPAPSRSDGREELALAKDQLARAESVVSRQEAVARSNDARREANHLGEALIEWIQTPVRKHP